MHKITPRTIELAVQYVKDETNLSDANKELGVSSLTATYIPLIRALKHAYRQGKLTIEIK